MTSQQASNIKKYKILITGFNRDLEGRDYSWTVANGLMNMKWPENIWVETRDMTYSYQSVKSQVEYLFLAFRPNLLIHLNYDIANRHVILEKCGFNRCYRLKDIFDYSPPTQCAVDEGEGRLETELDLEPLRKKGEEYCRVRNVGSKLKCVISKYPGESVPAYLYYSTLNYDPSKTLLVNIPSKNVYSIREINYALKGIMLEALNQMYQIKEQGE